MCVREHCAGLIAAILLALVAFWAHLFRNQDELLVFFGEGNVTQLQTGCIEECVTTPEQTEACCENVCDLATGDCAIRTLCALPSECLNVTCIAGTCVEESLVDCDDSDDCTDDICNPRTGICSHVDVACDDGDPCTDDACVGGACAHAPRCIFPDPPPADKCIVNITCNAFGNAGNGAACELVRRVCPQADPCTVVTCDSATGLCSIEEPFCPHVACQNETCTVIGFLGSNATVAQCRYEPRNCNASAVGAPACENVQSCDSATDACTSEENTAVNTHPCFAFGNLTDCNTVVCDDAAPLVGELACTGGAACRCDVTPLGAIPCTLTETLGGSPACFVRPGSFFATCEITSCTGVICGTAGLPLLHELPCYGRECVLDSDGVVLCNLTRSAEGTVCETNEIPPPGDDTQCHSNSRCFANGTFVDFTGELLLQCALIDGIPTEVPNAPVTHCTPALVASGDANAVQCISADSDCVDGACEEVFLDGITCENPGALASVCQRNIGTCATGLCGSVDYNTEHTCVVLGASALLAVETNTQLCAFCDGAGDCAAETVGTLCADDGSSCRTCSGGLVCFGAAAPGLACTAGAATPDAFELHTTDACYEQVCNVGGTCGRRKANATTCGTHPVTGGACACLAPAINGDDEMWCTELGDTASLCSGFNCSIESAGVPCGADLFDLPALDPQGKCIRLECDGTECSPTTGVTGSTAYTVAGECDGVCACDADAVWPATTLAECKSGGVVCNPHCASSNDGDICHDFAVLLPGGDDPQCHQQQCQGGQCEWVEDFVVVGCCQTDGEVCTSVTQCCSTAFCSGAVCCNTNGGVCTQDDGCCEIFDVCEGGECCRPQFTICTLSSQCCSGLCADFFGVDVCL